jgi:hypothetical protein
MSTVEDGGMRGIVRMLLAVRTVLAGAVCAVVTLTGCSVSVEPQGDPTISQENLEKGISDALEKAAPAR